MSYVSRNPAGAINGLFRNRQHDASEELEDDHPEIEAYKAGLHRPPVDFLREINDEIAYIMTWSPSNEPALPQPDPQDTSVPIPEDLNTPLVPFAEENGHGQETGEGAVPDLGPVADGVDPEVEADRMLQNMNEGVDLDDEISGLSVVRREELTAALYRRKSRKRRERMTGSTPDDEEQSIDRLLGLITKRGV